MRPRDESAHPVVEDAIDKGYLDTGRIYPIPGFTTHQAANEGRLSINRAGQHLGVSVSGWVTDQAGERCYQGCQDPRPPTAFISGSGARIRPASTFTASQAEIPPN